MGVTAVVAAFGLLLLGLGIWGVRTIQTGRTYVRQGNSSKAWPQTSGHVTASRVVDYNVSNYSVPKVSYAYRVADQSYTSDCIAFRMLQLRGSTARSIVAKYPVGADVPVYYDPQNPRTSVLEPGTAGTWMSFYMGAVLVVLSIAGAAYLAYVLLTSQ